MCGIVGILARQFTQDALNAVRRATDRLEHRGPDDSGLVRWPAGDAEGPFAALASRRLAILDLSDAGHQPMVTPDGRYALVLNGAIYNYVELREQLALQGHHFRSDGDTEVLLHGFAEWGADVLRRVIGMFAFAVYDTVERTLFLARDPFGIKPLYYSSGPGGFAFASEIDALLEFPEVSRRVNPQRLFDYLDWGGNTDDSGSTLFADVQQLEPAHSLTVQLENDRRPTPMQYWSADLTAQSTLSFEDAATRLREMFVESVRLHLRSDVPLGFALSGGIDSSSVLAVARHLLGPSADLHAFTYVTDDPSISEGPYPAIAAQATNAHHHTVAIEPRELPDAYPSLQAVQGEPIRGPSIYAQNRVFQLARQAGMKVILEGQGSDEMLAGYDAYVAGQIATLVRGGHLVRATRLFRRFPVAEESRTELARRVVRQLAPVSVLNAMSRRRFAPSCRSLALDWPWFEQRGVVVPPRWRGTSGFGQRDLLYYQLLHNPLQALLRYGDRNAMAYSLENRVPFLTTDLVQFVFSLPEDYIIDQAGCKKAVFRRAMRGLVPDEILDRRDKIGLATPTATWLNAVAPWVEEQLKRVRDIPGVDARYVGERWFAARATRRRADATRIWRWVSLVVWAEQRSVEFT